MRADAIDVSLFGRSLRIVVEHRESREALKADLEEFLSDDAAPTGFVMKLPQGTKKFHVLLDRSGLVLGRTRNPAECSEILRRHLEALAPAPPNTVRLQVRSLIGKRGNAVLALFPLFTQPPPTERRLDREGFRIVDRLNVDLRIEPSGPATVEQPTWQLSSDRMGCLGHAGTDGYPAFVEAVLIPGDSTPSHAQVVFQLASAVAQGVPLEDRVTAAERLAALPIRHVSLGERSDRYAALSRGD